MFVDSINIVNILSWLKESITADSYFIHSEDEKENETQGKYEEKVESDRSHSRLEENLCLLTKYIR